MVEIVKKKVELRVFVLSRFDKKPVKKEITVLVHLNSGQNAREKKTTKKPYSEYSQLTFCRDWEACGVVASGGMGWWWRGDLLLCLEDGVGGPHEELVKLQLEVIQGGSGC